MNNLRVFDRTGMVGILALSDEYMLARFVNKNCYVIEGRALVNFMKKRGKRLNELNLVTKKFERVLFKDRVRYVENEKSSFETKEFRYFVLVGQCLMSGECLIKPDWVK